MNRKITIPILLIILLSLASYFNIFQNEFVWDDYIFILDNQDIRSFSNLPLFFSQDVDGLYRPLRSLHYTFVYSIAGKNEFFYHFNSLFFHTLISILVFFIIHEIAGKRNVALIAALIFVAHPIHTGRVTNITAGFDLLGIFFMLLAFYLYIKYSKSDNKNYLIINKPSGILVHPTNKKENNTIANWVLEKHPRLIEVGDSPIRPGIVHRLDKEVSGLMVIALNQKYFNLLKEQFQDRSIKKEYTALIYGKLININGEIKTPLERDKKTGLMKK